MTGVISRVVTSSLSGSGRPGKVARGKAAGAGLATMPSGRTAAFGASNVGPRLPVGNIGSTSLAQPWLRPFESEPR